MWKTISKWVRDRASLDVDVDIDDGKVAVSVTVKFNEAVLFSEEFEWPLPGTKLTRVKLPGRVARRRRLAEGT